MMSDTVIIIIVGTSIFWFPALLYLCAKAVTIGFLRARKNFDRESRKP